MNQESKDTPYKDPKSEHPPHFIGTNGPFLGFPQLVLGNLKGDPWKGASEFRKLGSLRESLKTPHFWNPLIWSSL